VWVTGFTESVSGWGKVIGWPSKVSTRTETSSHPARFHTVGQHDQGVTLLFPHQMPEVTHSLGQGALGCNELLVALETLVEGSSHVRRPSDVPHTHLQSCLPRFPEHPSSLHPTLQA
jgi:hypothetical protein